LTEKQKTKTNPNILPPVNIEDHIDHCKSGSERIWTLLRI